MEQVINAAPETTQEAEEVVAENRGYWGYREVTEEDMTGNAVDEGGCGCGCGK